MHNLCLSEDLPEGDSRGFQVNGVAVFAVKKNGRILVYRNACPHRGIELEWVEHRFLSPEKTLIQCSTHGAQFVIESGLCVAGPCMGESLVAIPHHIKNGQVLIDLL